jgi:outer membrane cobalamin receptor
VVNIVTRGAEHHQGAAVTATVGQHEDVDARQTVSLRYSEQFGKDASASLLFYAGRNNRGNKPYTDFYGETYDFSEGGELPLFVDFGARLKDFKLRFIYENYRVDVRDNYDASTPTPFRISYENIFLGIEHPITISEHATVTPRLSALRQKPWEVEDFTSMDGAGLSPYYRKAASRLTGSLTFNWDVTEKVNVLAGTEAYLEQGKVLGSPDLIEFGFQSLQEGEMEVTHENVAAFAQGQLESIIGILTLGARLESHSAYGASFVPRAGLTRVLGPAHVKLLASRAFRAPGLENINAQSPSDPVRPEQTTVYELEAGVRIGKNAIVTGNVYDITIDDPIVYLFDETTGEEGYENFTTTGSRGFELEARLRFLPRVWVTTSYSFYSTAGKNEVEVYDIPTLAGGVREGSVLGIPKHKVAFLGSVQIVGALRAQPQFVYLSPRAGYLTAYDMDGNLAIGDTDPSYLASFFLSYQDLGLKGLDVSAGVHNLLDDDMPLVQPYFGYHPPVPWPGREYMLRVSWEQ